MLPVKSYKRLILAICFNAISLQVTALQNSLEETQADKTISQLYHSLKYKPTRDVSTRTEIISNQFLQKPYLITALGEGQQGQFDQFPLYRTDVFDCETYVDTVLALVLANDPYQFKQCINKIRYLNGNVSYLLRNHFTCLDWNQNNQRQGFVKDITTTFLNKENQPVANYAHALIDKPSWYNHKTIDSIRLKHSNAAEQAKHLQALKQLGRQLSKTPSTIPYIPLSALFDRTGKADEELFHQIPNGAIIEIVRPNWDLTKEIGTHLNVSHLGFAIWKHGALFFRQASSTLKQVDDAPLIHYLRNAQKNPTIKGINIQIILPHASCR